MVRIKEPAEQEPEEPATLGEVIAGWAVALGYAAAGAITYGHVQHIAVAAGYGWHDPGPWIAGLLWPLYWLGQLGYALT